MMNNLLALIETHNNNVAAFRAFCEKVDEANGGGFPADKWLLLFQTVPPFAKHASLIVEEARAAGINAKYNAQDGVITVYEPDERSGAQC